MRSLLSGVAADKLTFRSFALSSHFIADCLARELFTANFRKALGTWAGLCSNAGEAVAGSHLRH
jgi:hypothetical protein